MDEDVITTGNCSLQQTNLTLIIALTAIKNMAKKRAEREKKRSRLGGKIRQI